MGTTLLPHLPNQARPRRAATRRRLRLTVVSTYPPRRCGLASYTTDLRDALAVAAPGWRVEVCAVDRDGLAYGPQVPVVIRQDDPEDYRRAADAIADRGCDLVLIQHEYGIFGGPDGVYVTNLAARLRERGVPYAVTLHTVLAEPSPGQAGVLRDLCGQAAGVTVFTDTARRLVAGRFADPRSVAVVPHGAPEVLRAPVDPARLRPVVADALAEITDDVVLTTFGLIGPGKGLEVALAALPAVAARHPRVRYVIAGATHPEEVRRHGERYRESLVELAERLGVQRHVRFVDAFLTDAELAALLARTDVYVTPYRSTEQICSGALTFAVAAGCPVVSTAYRYAEDLLAAVPGRDAPGLLVPTGDEQALAEAVIRLLDDPSALARARRAADTLGATLTWPAVAARLARTLSGFAGTRAATAAAAAPPLRFDHLDRLVDAGGIIQFANGGEPDLGSGYCVDDVARLGIVAAGLYGQPGEARARGARWLDLTLRFLAESVGPGGLRNLRDHDGTWRDEPHLGDHVGRAIWGLGVLAANPLPRSVRHTAGTLLDRLLPLVPHLTFPRSAAYAALGLARVPTRPGVRDALRQAAGRLVAAAEETAAAGRSARSDAATASGASAPGWRWYEPRLTYDNARLPQALLAAGAALDDRDMIRLALDTLEWYLGQVGLDGPHPVLRCVGNLWREREAARRAPDGHEGDEQPLDAAATVEALVEAWQVTRNWRYARLAARAHAWFHGANRAGAALYDPATGGCHDGLHPDGVNPNMGAESTLAYYQSLFAQVHAGLVRVPAARPGLAGSPTVTTGQLVEGVA